MSRICSVNKSESADRRRFAPARVFAGWLCLVAFFAAPLGAQQVGGEVLSAISEMRITQKTYGERSGLLLLDWTNGTRYTLLELFIDDTKVAELDGELNEYQAEDVAVGDHVFGLRGQSGDLVSELVTVFFTVRASTPLGEPVAGISCSYFSRGGGTIEVTWSEGEDSWASGLLELADGESLQIERGAASIAAEGVGPEVPEFAVYFLDAEGYYSDRIVPVCSPQPTLFRRGDCNSDGAISVSDAIFQLNHLYLGRERWYCDDACDANDDGRTNLSDAITIIGYVFLGEIEPIGMDQTCRPDETEDFLGGICECPL
tara:strand:- start:183 stop:1130 length:948 start_codon:yes stop_codon:yes gene_type:complete